MEPDKPNGETSNGGGAPVSPRRTVKDAMAISLDDAAIEAEEPGSSVTTSNQEASPTPEPAAVRPGAVSVSSAAPRGKPRRTVAPASNSLTAESAPNPPGLVKKETSVEPGSRNVRPSRRSQTTFDAKTVLKQEMESLKKSNGPSKPGAVSVSSDLTSERRAAPSSDPKGVIKREMEQLRSSGEPSRPGAVSVSSSGVQPSKTSDPKGAIKREMDQLKKSGEPSRPGAMSVSSTGAASSNPDPKARIKAEMDALRSGEPSRPGAVPVTTSSIAASATERPSDPKARIKAEMDALRSGEPSRPGAVPVTTSSIAASAAERPSDPKARIKAEMESLRSSAPGAVSVSAEAAAADQRTSRAARKARGRNSARAAPTSTLKPAPEGRTPGAVPGTISEVSEAERKKAPPPPPTSSRMVDAERAKAEADKLMDYDRHKPKSTPPAEAARMQQESNKSMESASSSKQMAAAESSKSMGLEEMARQKKEAEAGLSGGRSQTEINANGEEIVSAVVVDEDALEAEYQARLMENVVSAEVLDQKEIEARNRRRCICRCCCPLILVAIILGITLPLTKEDPVTITNSPTGSPTPQSEYDFLVDIFEPISGDELFVEGSPANLAIDWLLNDDPAMLDIKAQNRSTLVNRYSFATFYFAVGGPNWTDQINFMSNRSVCDWHVEREGILCLENGDPFFLRINGNGLNGTMPVELSAVTSLSELSIVLDTDVGGTLPTEYGVLTNMNLFQFAFNSMSGTVPSEYDSMVNLETFNLLSNRFTGPLPKLVSLDHSLEKFMLQFNDFTGTIPPLRRQSELLWFVVRENARLEGTLPDEIYSQFSLEWIGIENTNIGGTLSEKFGALEDLAFFHATGTSIQGSIPAALGQLSSSMLDLRLDSCSLTGTIPPQLGNLEKLHEFWVNGNQLSGTIPNELAGWRDMQEIRLAGNSQLGGTVPAGFADLKDLVELTLEGTNITGGLQETFCSSPVLRTSISSNCGGDVPQIQCDCCVECCIDGEDCELNLFGACEVLAGNLADEERGNECTCAPDGSNLSCFDTCQVCSTDGTVCARAIDYGFTLDESGDKLSYAAEYEYTLGPPDKVVYHARFEGDFGFCDVDINGERCNSCTTTNCPNGFPAFSIDCENLQGVGSFQTCFPEATPPGGPLEVFRFWDLSQTNSSSCQPMLERASD